MIKPVSSSVSFENTHVAFSAKSDYELNRAYLLFASMNAPFLVKTGTWLLRAAFALRLPVKGLVKKTLFQQFCGGESIEGSSQAVASLAAYNIGTILDYSVEGAEDEASFDKTTVELLATVYKAAETPEIPFCVFKVTGLASTPLLEKVSAGKALTEGEQQAYKRVKDRVEKICVAAFERGVRVFVDAEESWIQPAIDALANDMMARFNKSQPIVYNTYQLYLKHKLAQLEEDCRLAEEGGYLLGAKIVRGAYMEKERARAARLKYPDPVQPGKPACDNDYDAALAFCVANRQRIAICAGTHNEYSSYLLTELIDNHNCPRNDSRIFFAQLYGMSDHISFNLAHEGYNVAKYVPYGPVEKVLPYLFRRAEENTSISGQSSREFRLIKKERIRRRAKKAIG